MLAQLLYTDIDILIAASNKVFLRRRISFFLPSHSTGGLSVTLNMITILPLASFLFVTQLVGAAEPNSEQAKAIVAIKELGGTVIIDETSPGQPALKAIITAGPALPYVKALPGLQSLELNGAEITDAGLKCVENLSKLEGLWLYNTKATDAGFEHFRGLTALKTLYVGMGTGPYEGRVVQRPPRTEVTGAGLVYLKSLHNLEKLRVVQTTFTGVGLGISVRCRISEL